MKKGLLLLLSLFVLTACHAQTVRIMPLGASYTAGLEVINGVHSFNGGYRKTLETLLVGQNINFDFVGSQEDPPNVEIARKHHEGHPGWKIGDIDGSVKTWVTQYRPDVILLLVGTNDLLQNYDVKNAPARLNALVGHLLAMHSVKYVFVSAILPLADPRLNEEAREYNSAIAALMQERHSQSEPVTWIDMYNDSGVTVQDLGDGIHPDDQGYDKMGRLWFTDMMNSQ